MCLSFLAPILLCSITIAQEPDISQEQHLIAGPSIRIESPQHDFGMVSAASSLEHEFILANIGTQELEILRIEPPFGCSVIGQPPRVIEPDQTARLNLKLDPDSLRGRFQKQVVVKTSDPAHATVVLTLLGELRRSIEVTPPSAGFGKVLPDELRERTITITNQAAEPISITLDAPPADAAFGFHLVETIKGREFKLFVNTRPPYETGALRASAMLRTTLDSQKELSVSAYGIVPARLEVVPASIQNLSPPAGETGDAVAVQVLQFNNYGKDPVRLTGATASGHGVKAEIVEVNPGRRYRVVVTAPPTFRPPNDGTAVTLKTDDDEFPKIDLPFGATPANATGARRRKTGRDASNKTATTQGTPAVAAMELIGKPAPSLSLMTVDGAPLTNEEFSFHPATVLNFFAANCGFSKRQMPKVEELRTRYESQGVRFVNVCETMRQPMEPGEVRGVLADLNANLELAIDPGNRAGRIYKVRGYPLLMIVRKDGVVEHVISGNKANLVQAAGAKLDDLLQADARNTSRDKSASTRPG